MIMIIVLINLLWVTWLIYLVFFYDNKKKRVDKNETEDEKFYRIFRTVFLKESKGDGKNEKDYRTAYRKLMEFEVLLDKDPNEGLEQALIDYHMYTLYDQKSVKNEEWVTAVVKNYLKNK